MEQIRHETIESAASYTVGTFGILIAKLADIAAVAQSIACILGCVLVTIRLIYDAVRLVRYIKKKQ